MFHSKAPSIHNILALPIIAAISLSVSSAAAEEEYVSKAEVKTLHQASLPGMEGKEVIIKHFKVPPGFVGGKHFHPGPVFVYVLDGEFTISTEGKTETYRSGDLYREPLNKTMQASNRSKSEAFELLVFQIGDIGKPMMIKAE